MSSSAVVFVSSSLSILPSLSKIRNINTMAVGVVQTYPSNKLAGCVCGACVDVNQVNQFDKLVLALKEALGPSSGLTSDDVNVEDLTRLMHKYNSKETEWAQYALGDESRGYTRNLVDEGNGKSNLVSPGPSPTSCILSHPLTHDDSLSSYGHRERVVRSTTTEMHTA